jgi:Fe-S-cluster containining protein
MEEGIFKMNNCVYGSYGDYLKMRKSGVTDFTKNGKCSCCGGCCTDELALSKYEISTIKNYIKKNNIKIKRQFVPLATPVIDKTCPFLDTTGKITKCQIYDVRPLICRTFICSEPQKIYEMLKDFKKYKPVKLKEYFYPLG